MPAYIDEVLHLIEFCNGSTATEWGAKRAAMGHPEPFGLEYLGIGNEDLIDDVFKNRFQQIFDAVKAAYPDIVVVGTVGPAPSGQDYEEGWKYAREAGLPIVDEHSYQSSSWWFHNLDHYDHTDRKGPKVYLGEYGSWNTQLINGLSEAAFMGRMELNGDVVAMASYAPLFAKNGHHSWNPDLIYFDDERASHPYLNNITITTAAGDAIDLGNVAYDGRTIDTPLDLHADSYSIYATVVYYEGKWGMDLICGDIDGKNHNITSFGRAFEIKVVRDGTAYNLDGTEWSMDEVFPGTEWQVRINALDAEAEIDLNQVLEELGVSAESRASATATVLAGTDPYAGEIGKASPTVPVESAIDLTSGAYTAPSWSFTTLTLHD